MKRENYMLPKIIFICFALFFIAMLQHSIPIISQAQQSNSQVRPFTDLTFEISVPTQTLLPLQPIPIVLKQSNRTNQAVLGYKSIGFGKIPVYLYVQKSGSDEKTLISQLTPLSSLTEYKNIEISPNASYTAKEWITLGLNMDFPEPGTYEIQAVLANADRTQFIESNKVSIEIQEPTGSDREAYNLIKNSPSKEYLFSGAQFNKVKNTLEAITTRFPNSVYAKGSSFVLGEVYFGRKNYSQALLNLLRLENDRDFIFAEKVRNYLAEIRRLPINQQQ
jgi:hypothetical protein